MASSDLANLSKSLACPSGTYVTSIEDIDDLIIPSYHQL